MFVVVDRGGRGRVFGVVLVWCLCEKGRLRKGGGKLRWERRGGERGEEEECVEEKGGEGMPVNS